ncbi:hypothetical protein AWB70_06254 [Caballeronia cordobensis]|uniref:Uncharacterized protein n=1 Tax=Caballeronia cordobensis TaxID=1353886 RepID=A0A158JBJ4_CABCO|nr:hypothetical protein [Caballeronia cordobensis]SAL66177.1 hypothetical protein AWB70_06254 [Caballeronia cordobensis]
MSSRDMSASAPDGAEGETSTSVQLSQFFSTFLVHYPQFEQAFAAFAADVGRLLVTASQTLAPIVKGFAVLQAKDRRAEELSKLIHSETEGLSSLQERLTAEPIDAWTLIALISKERELSESELEKRLVAEYAADSTERGRIGAHGRHHSEATERKRRDLEAHCREQAARMVDGRPLYRSKAALIRDIADQSERFGLNDFGAIARRIDAMNLQVPHWKRRRASKATTD